MSSSIQRVLFPKDWKILDVLSWLLEHKMKPIKLTEEGNYYHARLEEPIGKSYSSKQLKNGVILTIQYH